MALQEAFDPNLATNLPTGLDKIDGRYYRQTDFQAKLRGEDVFASLKGKKVAWVGDTNNISNEMLVTLPRLGMRFALASPKGYDKVEDEVWKRV